MHSIDLIFNAKDERCGRACVQAHAALLTLTVRSV